MKSLRPQESFNGKDEKKDNGEYKLEFEPKPTSK
jgi:hypothetical protein